MALLIKLYKHRPPMQVLWLAIVWLETYLVLLERMSAHMEFHRVQLLMQTIQITISPFFLQTLQSLKKPLP